MGGGLEEDDDEAAAAKGLAGGATKGAFSPILSRWVIIMAPPPILVAAFRANHFNNTS